ncbi:MAG TPA: biopolymer transporter ExbD [Polyangiaceae bacterium]|nr:biopolymer transporter ExbD [Polyangiaceae bacterium]
MAAHVESGDGEPIAAINVTPLVDIMLVLLVVFMVTARLIAQSAVPLDLPHAASANAEQSIWTIAIAKNGETRLNGDVVRDRHALADRTRAELRKNPELRAVIAASKHTEHGEVVSVLDELRNGGLTRVAFGTSPEETP